MSGFIASSTDGDDLRYTGELSAPYPLAHVQPIDRRDPTINVLFCNEATLRAFLTFAGISHIPSKFDKFKIFNIAPVATIFAAAATHNYTWAETHFLTIREAAYHQLKGLQAKGLDNLSVEEKRIYGCSIVASFLHEWVTIDNQCTACLMKAEMPLDIRDMRRQNCQLHFVVEEGNNERYVTTTLPLDELCNLEQNGIFLEVLKVWTTNPNGERFELNPDVRRETNITSVACQIIRNKSLLWKNRSL